MYLLKPIPYFKAPIIALVWALVCVGLNLEEFSWKGVMLFIDCFVFILLLCFIFDFKDLSYDQKQGVKTVPALFKSKPIFIVFITLALVSLLSLFDSILSGTLCTSGLPHDSSPHPTCSS